MMGTKTAISWTHNLNTGAQFEPSKGPGLPGLHYRRDLPAGVAELVDSQGGQPYLNYVCPCGCGCVGTLPLAPFAGRPGWQWNADRVLPTLTPSIKKRYGCGWHGYLTAGVWENCPDWAPPGTP